MKTTELISKLIKSVSKRQFENIKYICGLEDLIYKKSNPGDKILSRFCTKSKIVISGSNKE